MAKGDEITTKFKVDISDLKKGITDATNQIKLADATFKAATAGMDDWTKSTEGLKAKLSQLDSTLSAQKSKLENYIEQLKRQENAYDENGKPLIITYKSAIYDGKVVRIIDNNEKTYPNGQKKFELNADGSKTKFYETGEVLSQTDKDGKEYSLLTKGNIRRK